MFDVMQGDAYSIAFVITDGEGVPINPSGVEDVEIVLGGLIKRFSDEGISFADGKWLYHFSQREAFDFNEDLSAQVRVKTKTGMVTGRLIGKISLKISDSREVL